VLQVTTSLYFRIHSQWCFL